MSRADAEMTPDDRALKVQTAALIDRCGGTMSVANVCECSPSLISAYASMAAPGRSMPVSMVQKLERLCGAPVVTRWLAKRANLDCEETPGQVAVDDVAALALEAAHAQTEILEALSDGKVSSAERADIRSKLGELQAIIDQIGRKVESP